MDDSVGTGFYMVDIHPCGANERGRMMMPRPFQIPLAALTTKEPSNFLPAGKSLGVTHLTNGAFRLHPIEWMIGESAGSIASLRLQNSAASLRQIQHDLVSQDIPIVWFDDLEVSDPDFAAIQFVAIQGIYPLGADLHASPDAPITRAEAAVALVAWADNEHLTREDAIKRATEKGWMAVDHRNWFHGDLPLLWTDIREDRLPRPLPKVLPQAAPVRRRQFAHRLLTTP